MFLLMQCNLLLTVLKGSDFKAVIISDNHYNFNIDMKEKERKKKKEISNNHLCSYIYIQSVIVFMQ